MNQSRGARQQLFLALLTVYLKPEPGVLVEPISLSHHRHTYTSTGGKEYVDEALALLDNYQTDLDLVKVTFACVWFLSKA
jgi:hypothetical protein